MQQDELVLVGVIVSAHGIKGQVKIHTYTAKPENICDYPLVDVANKPLKAKFIRLVSSNVVICSIYGCNDRNKAEALKGTKLFATKADLPSLEEDEFYVIELEGKRVITPEGQDIGVVKAVHDFGAGVILEISFRQEDELPSKSVMLPFSKEFFPSITAEAVVYAQNPKAF